MPQMTRTTLDGVWALIARVAALSGGDRTGCRTSWDVGLLVTSPSGARRQKSHGDAARDAEWSREP